MVIAFLCDITRVTVLIFIDVAGFEVTNLFLSSSTLSRYRFIYVFVTICNLPGEGCGT